MADSIISQEVNIEMLEKLADGTFKIKYPKTKADLVIGLTKGYVGLGNVENYGVATQAEAEAGIVNNKYMTPLRVKEAILSTDGIWTPIQNIDISASVKEISIDLPTEYTEFMLIGTFIPTTPGYQANPYIRFNLNDEEDKYSLTRISTRGKSLLGSYYSPYGVDLGNEGSSDSAPDMFDFIIEIRNVLSNAVSFEARLTYFDSKTSSYPAKMHTTFGSWYHTSPLQTVQITTRDGYIAVGSEFKLYGRK